MKTYEFTYTGEIIGDGSVEAETFDEAIKLAQKKLDKMQKDGGWEDYNFDFYE